MDLKKGSYWLYRLPGESYAHVMKVVKMSRHKHFLVEDGPELDWVEVETIGRWEDGEEQPTPFEGGFWEEQVRLLRPFMEPANLEEIALLLLAKVDE